MQFALINVYSPMLKSLLIGVFQSFSILPMSKQWLYFYYSLEDPFKVIFAILESLGDNQIRTWIWWSRNLQNLFIPVQRADLERKRHG